MIEHRGPGSWAAGGRDRLTALWFSQAFPPLSLTVALRAAFYIRFYSPATRDFCLEGHLGSAWRNQSLNNKTINLIRGQQHY